MTSIPDRLSAALSGRYQIERELGQGGMATVYLAQDLRHDRRVALKVLRPDLAAALGPERFLREIRIAANLTHPNILPLHDSGEASGFLFYVMPYIEGESLRARLARESELPVEEAVRILREVSDALSHAHTMGVVHRDIKPDNVLLAGRHAMVTDFGVAKAVSDATGRDKLTTAGVALGTPLYMAPEQAAGESHIDARADIYALGAMGYELLAGRPPFTGNTAQMILAAHVTEVPRPVTDHRPAVPAPLAQVIMKCLEKKPADRWQTADDVLRQLEALVVTPSGGITPTSTRPVGAVPRPLARHRRVAVIAGVVLVIGVGAVWMASRGGGPPLDPNLVAVFPFQFSAGSDVAYLREGIVNLLESNLTGEGGPRAVASQTAISAWQRAGGSAAEGLTEAEEQRVARTLGAGLLLRGGMVGSAANLVINATLTPVTGSGSPVQASVSGSADSVAGLARRLAAQLLSLGAGEEASTAAALADVPLAALRAYLEGQSAYREGRFEEALAAFGRAIGVDSTFALAALAHSISAGWVLTAPPSPGVRLAWAYRDRLSPRDQTLLDAYRPNYPAPLSVEERYRARERGVAELGDRVEAWYLLADEIFHFGRVIGMTEDEVRERSSAGFQRAHELDPRFAPVLTHLLDLALDAEDPVRIRAFADSFPDFYAGDVERSLSAALVLGDSAAVGRWRAGLGQYTPEVLNISGVYALFSGSPEDGLRAHTERVRRAGSAAERAAALRALRLTHWRAGQPRAALAVTDRLEREVRQLELDDDVATILAALFGDGDTAQAGIAVARLAGSERPPRARCVLGLWHLARQAQSDVLRETAQLRTQARTAGNTPAGVTAQVCATLLTAVTTEAGAMRPAVQYADSLARTGPPLPPDIRNAVNLALARAWESLGDPRRARDASRRWEHFGAVTTSPMLAEQGRLSALLGDTAEAVWAWDQYLRPRGKAEPEQRAKDDLIREQLRRLVGEKN
ncbi:MAG: protein kinase [Gemmatimonadetes bacterium]|nr:protein kinase [Gemmatimonadota bacterium]